MPKVWGNKLPLRTSCCRWGGENHFELRRLALRLEGIYRHKYVSFATSSGNNLFATMSSEFEKKIEGSNLGFCHNLFVSVNSKFEKSEVIQGSNLEFCPNLFATMKSKFEKNLRAQTWYSVTIWLFWWIPSLRMWSNARLKLGILPHPDCVDEFQVWESEVMQGSNLEFRHTLFATMNPSL